MKSINNVKAHFCKGNIKLGDSILTFSKLCGDVHHAVKTYDAMIQGTCAGHCDGCRTACYVRNL